MKIGKHDVNDELSVNNVNCFENSQVLTSDYISYAQITTGTVTGYAGDYITLKATFKND